VKGLNLLTPAWSRVDLDKETHRVYEICDGCRRCFNLCPSFNTLLDRIDRHDSDVTKLAQADLEQVANECYYCKLCYNHCPYTPPHQYAIDFPRLMVAWKKQIVQEKGARWRDRLLIQTDRIGPLGSRLAPLANRLLRSRWARKLGERLFGVHAERWVLPFASQAFGQWWRNRGTVGANVPPRAKVALFAGCLINYQATDVGKAVVQVFEKNGVEVAMPDQQCCGMPSFDLGDVRTIIQAAQANLRFLQPWLDQGYDIVTPLPSCSLMLKREYPYVLPGDETARLSQRTFDVCEYLMRLKKEGHLSMDFVKNPGRVAYQVPCHLRDQNIGFKSKELMELTGATVEVVERCSGHDGTWSAKTEFFDLSMGIARKAVREMADSGADVTASDCPLAAVQLDQAGIGGSPGRRRTLHPIEIVRDAYGLPS